MWLPLMHPLLRTWPKTQACALTGNRTSDLLVHRPALNPIATPLGLTLNLPPVKLVFIDWSWATALGPSVFAVGIEVH